MLTTMAHSLWWFFYKQNHMNLHIIHCGLFKLDGGAMFGVVPKKLWSRTNQADENNMCTWALRCLLIEDGDKLILIDNGMGDKQDDKFFSHYYPHGDDSLEPSLQNAGFEPKQIGAYLLCGLPGQNLDDVEQSVKLVRESGITPVLAYYTPIPGTALWEEAKAASRYDLAADPVYTNNAIFPCRAEGFSWSMITRMKEMVHSG